MGYRATQQKSKRKHAVLKRGLLCVFILFLIGISIFSHFVPSASWSYYFNLPNVGKRQAGELRIHFLDVGQGDSTIVELPDGKVMLIDGGEDSTRAEKNLLRYLNALKIDTIDYLVITHTDKDHCGSLEEVFRYKKVVAAYLPLSFSLEKREYARVFDRAEREGCALINPSKAMDLSSADGEYPYTLRMLYPYEKENVGGVIWEEDPSAVMWLDYFGTSALFGGDMSESVEADLVYLDTLGLHPKNVALSSTEILKVSHHGSKNSNGNALLEYLGVKTAFISCGAKNGYGHPHAEVLERLNAVGAEIYRTDTQGHLMLTATPQGEYSVRQVK